MKKTILIALSSLIMASGSAFAADHAKTDTSKPAQAKAVHQKSAGGKHMTHGAQKSGTKSTKTSK